MTGPPGIRPVRRPPARVVLPLLLVAAAAAVIGAAACGSVAIPLERTAAILLKPLGWALAGVAWSPEEETILLTLRLPRAVAAAMVGAALAVAGALYQGLLRNPMADPYVVGTSGGAALGAAVGMLFSGSAGSFGAGVVPLCALVGALAATFLVLSLATVGGRLPIVTVLLSGFAVSTLLGYTVSLLLVVNDRLQLQMPRLYAWLLGGIAVTGWEQVALVGPLILATIFVSLALSRSLNALSLGEDVAATLGVSVEREKRRIIAAGSLLTAGAVSLSGLVGFVGLLVPHLVRLVCGPDHRLLLPASALAGAVFLTLADLLARTLLPPAELPVGIITALVGGPFFLWLLRRGRREYQW